MILDVRSSISTFHHATFAAGLNVVLADTAIDSDENESTNGLGKTTLIRIIRFCLGSSSARDRVLSHPDLAGVWFGINFIFDRVTVEVDRQVGEDVVVATRSFCDDLGLNLREAPNGKVVVSIEDWRQALSQRLIAGDPTYTDAPSFGEIVSYLSRVSKAAYSDPLLAYVGQPGPSKRLSAAYLLGLNWQDQRRLQNEIAKRTQVNAAIKAYAEAQVSAEEKSIGDLEAERVVLENAVASKREEVADFNVREDYRDLEFGLARVDRDLHDSINENHADSRLLEYYERSAKELPEQSGYDPVEILRNAGAIFQADALRSIEEISNFHAQIYKNRSDFLRGEIARLRSQIRNRNDAIDVMVEDKSNILRVLRSSGALETLIDLQSGMRELEAELVTLRARIDERKRFDRRKDEIARTIVQVRSLLKQDLEDRRSIVDEAVSLFAEFTKYLYGVPGKLAVDIKDSGYAFGFSIDREGSDGVDQMVVFCFDLTIAALRARRRVNFLTLIHDSSMFADVDPRQYGLALQLAAAVSEREGFQYICCLNAGALPKDHLGRLDLEEHVRLRLTDDGDSGRLLGFRLSPRER